MEKIVNFEDIFKIRSDFDLEVYKTTQSLITALAAVQQFDLSTQNRFISNIDVSMDIKGLSVEELNESTEQLIYRGWITSIIRAWESYRKQIANQGFSPDAETQQILQTVIGDLTKIRNSSTHGSDIVGKDSKCRVMDCEILKWFELGEKIIFRISHVLDFLHHLGLLQGALFKVADSNQSDFKLVWLRKKNILFQSIGRKVISVKDSGITEGKPNERFVSVLFDNGLFGAFNPKVLNINFFESVQIIDGNLQFDDGPIIKVRDIYRYLVRMFPPRVNWVQEWAFKPKETGQVKLSTFEPTMSISLAEIIEVNTED